MTVPLDLRSTVYDDFAFTLQLCFTGFLFLLQTPVLYRTCYRVIHEKAGTREAMRMMGLSKFAYWLAWLIHFTAI